MEQDDGSTSVATRCEDCRITFDSEEKLKQHKGDARYHLLCPKCSAEYQSEDGLRRHMLQAHPAKQDLECRACSKVFTRLGGLVGHMESGECRAISGPDFIHAVREKMIEDTSSLTLANYIKYGQTTPGFNLKRLNSSNVSTSSDRTLVYRAIEPRYNNVGALSFEGAATAEVPNPHNPNNSTFNALNYYVDVIKKYKCPHKGCIKSFDAKRAFITHLRSAHSLKEKLKCRNCNRLFASITALTQHCENELSKCKIRYEPGYAFEVDALTAGVVAVDGHHADATVRYVNGLTLAPPGVKANAAKKKAAEAAEEDEYYGYWEHNRPTW